MFPSSPQAAGPARGSANQMREVQANAACWAYVRQGINYGSGSPQKLVGFLLLIGRAAGASCCRRNILTWRCSGITLIALSGGAWHVKAACQTFIPSVFRANVQFPGFRPCEA